MNLVRNFVFGVTTATLARYAWSSVYSPKYPSSYTVCTTGGGIIYTVDEANPTAECISVKDGRLVAVGPRDSVIMASGTVPVYETKPGSIVVPGLSDPHAHILEYGWKKQLVLDGSNSIEEVLSRIKTYLRRHPEVADDPTAFIQGMGWDQNRWASKQFPTADDLSNDPELAGKCIVLLRVDGHATWVSRPVVDLMIAGGKIPKDVDGGEVIRDKGGFPTGIFVDNAMSLVPIPDKTPAQIADYFKTAVHDALEVGLTSIHDAGGQDEYIGFYKWMAGAGKLPIRIYLMRAGPSLDDIDGWNEVKPLIDYGENGRLNMRSVKLFMDGALGSWGASLLEPYSDKNSTSGLLTTEPEEIRKKAELAWRYGWQVNVHAIGDRANQIVLNIFEHIQSKEPGFVADHRPRIEHSQIMTLDDLERSGRLGVINSVQPTHATSDMEYAESRLGPQRIRGAYAFKTLLRNSRFNVLPLGSDFPIEGINPLLGFYAAVSRLSVDGDSPHGPGGWYPSEALTRVEALKGMTLDSAYASFSEHELGSLEKGKKADFVVLDRDIMQINMSTVLSTKVEATVIDGEVLYGRDDASSTWLLPVSLIGVDLHEHVQSIFLSSLTNGLDSISNGPTNQMDYQPIVVKKYPRISSSKSNYDSRYWRQYKHPVFIKEYAPVTSVHFSPSKPHRYAVTAATRVQIYAPRTQKVTKTISRFKDVARSGHIRSDGKLVIAADDTGLVQIFDMNSRAILRTLDSHKQPVHVAKFSTLDHTQVLSCSDDNTVKLWDVPSQSAVTTFTSHTDYVRSGQFSTSSPHLLLTGSYDGTVRLFDSRSGEAEIIFGRQNPASNTTPVEQVLMFPSGTVVLSSAGPILRVWDLVAGGKCMRAMSNHQKTVTSLAFNDNASRLLTGSLDHMVKVYDVGTYRVVHTMRYPAPILSLAVSPDGSHIAAGMSDGTLSVRRRQAKPSDAAAGEFEIPLAALRAGTFGSFLGVLPNIGQGHVKSKGKSKPIGDVDEFRIEARRKKKLREYDKLLKSFKYSAALDSVLRKQVPPTTKFAVIQELVHRDGLRSALAGRDDVLLEPVLALLVKYVHDPRFGELVCDVGFLVIDMYTPVLGQSPLIDSWFIRLRKKISLEIKFQQELMKTKGMLDMLFSSVALTGT